MSRRSPSDRAYRRLLAELGHCDNDTSRALCLLDVLVCDNSGGNLLLELSDEHILEIVKSARDIAQRLRVLEGEEEGRALRVVRGGRA